MSDETEWEVDITVTQKKMVIVKAKTAELAAEYAKIIEWDHSFNGNIETVTLDGEPKKAAEPFQKEKARWVIGERISSWLDLIAKEAVEDAMSKYPWAPPPDERTPIGDGERPDQWFKPWTPRRKEP